jgi:hypothetical protein
MREMEWPSARGGAGLLLDRQRLNSRRLGGLGQTLISGNLDAAIAEIAPGSPMLGLYALAPEGAHALRIGRASALLVTPAPLSVVDGCRDGWCATSGDDGWAAIEIAGADAAQALMQVPPLTSVRVRAPPPFSSLACVACSRGRLPVSASMSRRPGWRRCSPGSTACEQCPTSDLSSAGPRSASATDPHERRSSASTSGPSRS